MLEAVALWLALGWTGNLWGLLTDAFNTRATSVLGMLVFLAVLTLLGPFWLIGMAWLQLVARERD